MSNAGNDSAAGSSTAPWATLDKAQATMTAGDTLYIRGGVYSGVSGLHWTKSGTAANPVTISAAPGEHPVFNGNGANALMNTGSQYTIIDGLEVTNYKLWAFDVAAGSSYVTIRNCYLHHILGAENAALVTSQSHHVTIENCVFEEMGRSLTQIKFDHAVYNSGGSHDITIRNNYFKNNYGGPAINNYHPPAPYNIDIYNNVFVMTKGTERSGVYAGTYGDNVHVYNNTFYLDGAGATTTYGVTLRGSSGDVAENNVFYFKNADIQGALVGANGSTVDYNLYFPTKVSPRRAPFPRA
jgi:pectate lyase